VRTFKESTREYVEQEIERIIKGTCMTGDVEYTFEYQKGYSAIINLKEEIEFIMDLAKSVPGVTAVNECEPQIG
jgi:amidohydrolase